MKEIMPKKDDKKTKKTPAKKVAAKKTPAKKITKKDNEALKLVENIKPEVLAEEKKIAKELDSKNKKTKPKKKKKKTAIDQKIQKLGSDANRSLSKYLQEISRYEPLTPDREVELAIKVKQGNRRALKELTEANLRFVVSVAKDYQGQGLPLTISYTADWLYTERERDRKTPYCIDINC